MFRGQNRNLKFAPGNGMAVTGLGRISLYKPRGTYQIIFEYLEPRGVGALQVAFEQLKARLADEGLFDEERKTPLPFLPRKIALITSPTGAVLHDMIKITRRRYENMHLLVAPVKVQGPGAVEDIVAAIDLVNRMDGVDVAIVARGGGSLEDLQAFNSEPVARAIAGSAIPVVSAVGHETDYTISDFVADLRAPTPSAAAELVVPNKEQLVRDSKALKDKAYRIMQGKLKESAARLKYLSDNLVDPVKRIQDLAMRCDELQNRLFRSFHNTMSRQRELLAWRRDKLERAPIHNRLAQYSKNNTIMASSLRSAFRRRLELAVSEHNVLQQKLDALSPLSILDRGYSITRTVPDGTIVSGYRQVGEAQRLEVILSEGALEVSVEKRIGSGGLDRLSGEERRLDGNTDI
jgi:exodeoxyribonuclease VII large subunit